MTFTGGDRSCQPNIAQIRHERRIVPDMIKPERVPEFVGEQRGMYRMALVVT